MLIRYDKQITLANPDIYNHVSQSYIYQSVYYLVHSDYRQAVNLRGWLMQFLKDPAQIVKDTCNSIESNKDYDLQMLLIHKWVVANIKYVADSSKWKLDEYWQTPEETILNKTGDCEDGAILEFVLARMKGIPTNRLLILCGDVLGGGHAWLGYKPQEYPLNFVFMDWCYWTNINSIEFRNKFFIDKDNKVHEYSNKELKSNYYKVWWGINDETSITNFKYIFGTPK